MSPLLGRIPALARHPSVSYVGPFAVLLLLLFLGSKTHWNPDWQMPVWSLLLGAMLWLCWPRDLELRFVSLGGSTLLGVGVFLVWIAPDLAIPGYRNFLPFHNAFVGHVESGAPASVDGWVLFWRSFRAVALVPAIEELFWRAWLLRWLLTENFAEVPMGRSSAGAFWIVVLLFAAEHGPFWDVGLAAGILYNWWMGRTRSLADCIWAHGVTNACLSTYVIARGSWQYWQ
jgi:uncharacterized protein